MNNVERKMKEQELRKVHKKEINRREGGTQRRAQREKENSVIIPIILSEWPLQCGGPEQSPMLAMSE